MAEYTSFPMAEECPTDGGTQATAASMSNRLTALTNIAGALVSLALVAGVGVWGYELLVRDVSTIPVVQAASGDMRVRPQEPGGQLAQHQGLSVNAVAAEGTAARPADELRLAPKPIDLAEEDMVVEAAMVADAPQDAGPTELTAQEVATALETGDVDGLVAHLTDGVTPLIDLDGAGEALAVDDADADLGNAVNAVLAEVIAAERQITPDVDAPGVRHSLRPKRRPAEGAMIVPASMTVATPAVTEEVDPATLPVGTRLAQLGAFDTAEVARDQWDQLQDRFDIYLEDKKRVVQQASSGGRTFYRLRAMGFEDIADARRFCSTLVAENVDCIPVVTR